MTKKLLHILNIATMMSHGLSTLSLPVSHKDLTRHKQYCYILLAWMEAGTRDNCHMLLAQTVADL